MEKTNYNDTIKAVESSVPSLTGIVNRLHEAIDRTSAFTSEIENNLQLISRYDEPTKECLMEHKESNSYVDDMDSLISRLEAYNDRLAFSLRHIKELI